MSGGSKTQTTVQNSAPWSGAQPTLKMSLQGAQDIYKSGIGFQPYTGSTVVPYADQTVAGMQNIQDQSLGAMSGGGFNTTGFLKDLMGSPTGLTDMQQNVAGQLEGVAAGNELYGANPAFQRVLEQAQGDTAKYVDMGASGAGRYGSGAHNSVMAREIGNLTDRMLTSEYARQLGRQDAARTNLANLGQQGLMNRFGAVDSLPGAWDAQFAPARSLMGVGSMYEDLYGRQLADQLRIFQQTQQAPLNAVQWLNAIGSGAGTLGGNSTTTTQMPGASPLQTILGGALGIGSLLF